MSEATLTMDDLLEIIIGLSQESINKYPNQTDVQRGSYLEALMDVVAAVKRKMTVTQPWDRLITTFDEPKEH